MKRARGVGQRQVLDAIEALADAEGWAIATAVADRAGPSSRSTLWLLHRRGRLDHRSSARGVEYRILRTEMRRTMAWEG